MKEYNLAQRIGSKKPVVFLDFDNTITRSDTIDGILLDFSKDDKWLQLETKWKNHEIGSRECLAGQLKNVSVTKKQLDEYLSKIKLDPYFRKLTELLSSKQIKTIIVSDNFDYILRRILKNNGFKNLHIYCNSLKFSKNKLLLRFPFTNKSCRVCAHCKKKNMLANANKKSICIYVGDGLSDVCAAKCADIIFAKDTLSRLLKREKTACIPVNSLKDVYNHLRKELK